MGYQLPAGMRNNNPGNIKYVGQAGTRPSVNLDQGDPQAVYASPEAGMSAMYRLLQKKYSSGKVTPNQMIGDRGGWTPGNYQAAANVARTMGIRPTDDINLSDPASAAKFMRALMLQEHGPASNQYTDDQINAAIGGGFSGPTNLAGGGGDSSIMGGTVELPDSVPTPMFYDEAPAALARNNMNPFDMIMPSAQAGEMPPAVQASYEQPENNPYAAKVNAARARKEQNITNLATQVGQNAAANPTPVALTPEMQTLAKQLGQSAAAANAPLTAAQRASRTSPNGAPGLTRTTAPQAPFMPTGDGPIPMTDILTPQEKAYLNKDAGLMPELPPRNDGAQTGFGTTVDFTADPKLSAAPNASFVDQAPMPRLATEDISMQPNGAVLPGITHTAQPFPAAADNPVTGNSGGGGAQLPSGASAPKPEMNPNYFPPAPKAPGKFKLGNFLGALGMVMGALDQGSPELKGVSLQGYAHKPENTQLPIPKGLLGVMSILDLFKNVSDKVQGNVGNLGSSPIAQKIGSMFEQPEVDPNAVDPQTGMPQGMVDAANTQGLRNMAGLFLAAGQSQSGSDRAKILAELGNANNPTKQLYNMAQAQLMNTNVQDALAKRKRSQSSIAALQKADLSDFTPEQRRVLEMYQQMGDPEGAAGFLERLATANAQGVQLPDGTVTTKGAYNADAMNWSKNYQPVLQAGETKKEIISSAMDLMDDGILAGQSSDWKLAADKLSRLTGGSIDPKSLNREKFNALVIDLTLGRLKDLGGNDTEKEYERLAAAIAGKDTEPETIKYNLEQAMKRTIQSSTIASIKRGQIGTNAYGQPVKWDDSLVPDAYKPYWERANTKSDKPAEKSGGSSDSNTTPNKSFKKLWE